MKNTSLKELDSIGKLDFKKAALNHKLVYKSDVGFSKNIKFGIEIEALGDDFLNSLRKKFDISYFYDPDFVPYDIYKKNKWVLTKENSLKLENGEIIYQGNSDIDSYFINLDLWLKLKIPSKGGEISSPVFTDNQKTWKSIDKMIKYMKKHVSNLRVNDSCASHAHFSIDIFNNNPELLFSFMVLLAETEPILTRFFCGEYINLREDSKAWAKPFNRFFIKGLAGKFDMTSYESLLESIYNQAFLEFPLSFSDNFYKIYAFNFNNICSDKSRSKDTFENRIPNGTLEPKIIQNNIMLMGYLMEYVAGGKYDYERGLSLINISDYHEIDDERAFYVADMLPSDELKLDFLTQYYKDEKVSHSKQLVKSQRNFY